MPQQAPWFHVTTVQAPSTPTVLVIFSIYLVASGSATFVKSPDTVYHRRLPGSLQTRNPYVMCLLIPAVQTGKQKLCSFLTSLRNTPAPNHFSSQYNCPWLRCSLWRKKAKLKRKNGDPQVLLTSDPDLTVVNSTTMKHFTKKFKSASLLTPTQSTWGRHLPNRPKWHSTFFSPLRLSTKSLKRSLTTPKSQTQRKAKSDCIRLT